MYEWEPCDRFFKVTLIDGTRASGKLMRRKENGVWVYRKMTESEAHEDWANDAACF